MVTCQFVASRNTRERWCQHSQENLYLRNPGGDAVLSPLAEWLQHFQRMRMSASVLSEPFSLIKFVK